MHRAEGGIDHRLLWPVLRRQNRVLDRRHKPIVCPTSPSAHARKRVPPLTMTRRAVLALRGTTLARAARLPARGSAERRCIERHRYRPGIRRTLLRTWHSARWRTARGALPDRE